MDGACWVQSGWLVGSMFVYALLGVLAWEVGLWSKDVEAERSRSRHIKGCQSFEGKWVFCEG